jgi:alkyl hydroperoxide reductase subunit AhpF
MALLSDADRATVRAHLAGLANPVKMLLFTQTIAAPETALIAREVLDEVVGLNDLISLEEVNVVLEKDRAAAYGIDRIPAVAMLRGEEDTRIRFLGAPAGYEFVSLVDAVALAGSDGSGLSETSRALIAEHVSSPLDIRVFVTPT